MKKNKYAENEIRIRPLRVNAEIVTPHNEEFNIRMKNEVKGSKYSRDVYECWTVRNDERTIAQIRDIMLDVFGRDDLGNIRLTQDHTDEINTYDDLEYREEIARNRDHYIDYLGIDQFVPYLKRILAKGDKINYKNEIYILREDPIIVKKGDLYLYQADVKKDDGLDVYDTGIFYRAHWYICKEELPFCPCEKIKWSTPDNIETIDFMI